MWAVISLGLLLPGCQVPISRAWCPPVDGAETLFVDRSPERWRKLPKLEQLWEVSGDEYGTPLGFPRSIAVDSTSGMVALADHVRQAVILLDADGSIRAAFRPPRGQRQLGLPAALSWDSQNRLAVLDPVYLRMLVLNHQGRLLESRVFGWPDKSQFPFFWSSLTGHTIVGQPNPGPATWDLNWRADFHVVRATLGPSVEVDTLTTVQVPVAGPGTQPPIPTLGSAVPVATPLDERTVAVSGEIPQLRIRIFDSERGIVRQICQEAVALPLSLREEEFAIKEGLTLPENSQTLATVGRLFTSADGRLWVQRDRGWHGDLPDRWFGPRGATFDVFEPGGRYVGRVAGPPNGRVAQALGDTIYVIRDVPGQRVSLLAYLLVVDS